MISHLQANDLLDCYGELLTDRQKEIMELYFQADLSLSEIQEELGISRSAIQNALKKSIDLLLEYEDRLHILKREQALLAFKEAHPDLAAEIDALLEI